MIDLHFHCLPAIDDGPSTWEESVALCRAAADEGTDTIVATPHVLRDPWLNEQPIDRDDLILHLNNLLGGRPRILPGCEYFFSSDAVDLWEQGSHGPLTGLNRSSYLLTEFPATQPMRIAEFAVHELSLLNVTVVVAHPERNALFAEAPENLARLVDLGAIVQVTAGSFLGEFGRQAQNAVNTFLVENMLHLVGSDAHSLPRRPPQLAPARTRVEQLWGKEAATTIFETNPLSVINNAPIATHNHRSPITNHQSAIV